MCHTYNLGEKAFRKVYQRYPEDYNELYEFNSAQSKPKMARKIYIKNCFNYYIPYPEVQGNVYINDGYVCKFHADHFNNYVVSGLAAAIGRIFNVKVHPDWREISYCVAANGHKLSKINEFEFMLEKV